MSDQPFPAPPKRLLDALDKQFPEQSADLRWSDREVWFKAGQRDVVNFLRNVLRHQEEDALQRNTSLESS